METQPTVDDFKHGRVPREVRVRQLLDLAEEQLLEVGVAGFSIEELCRAAGVSRPVVYDCLGGRDEIYLAVVRRARGEFDDSLVRAAQDAPNVDAALRAVSETYFGILERDPRRWLLVFSTQGLAGPMSEQIHEMREETLARIAAVGRAFGASDNDPEIVDAVASALSGAGESLGRWWLRNRGVPRDRVVAYNTEIGRAVISHFADRWVGGTDV
jgi:AcrR family transcriptional regulator